MHTDYVLVFKKKDLSVEDRTSFLEKQEERRKKSESMNSVEDGNEPSLRRKQKELKDITMEDIVERLLSANFRVRMYYSADQEEIYMKVFAPIDLIQEQADRMQYKLELDETEIIKRLAMGDENKARSSRVHSHCSLIDYNASHRKWNPIFSLFYHSRESRIIDVVGHCVGSKYRFRTECLPNTSHGYNCQGFSP